MGQYSGKFVLRLHPDLHAQLARQAEQTGMSLNAFINSKLTTSSKSGLESIQSAFKNQLSGVVLFGSQVRGEARPQSDIDLLIVLKRNADIHRRLYKTWDEKVTPVLGEKYSPQIVSLPDDIKSVSSLWLEAAFEGEVQLDSNNELRPILQAIKKLILEGYYVRKLSYGQPYWVRSKDAK